MPTAFLRYGALAALGLALGACASGQHLSSDFGRAVREDAMAQIADPDARYSGDPAPASNGARSALAQSRYERNAVIKPMVTTTSTAVGAAPSAGAGAGSK
jgi:hypothetical protein